MQSYYVMRTHSHTDRQQLWKVMSRPIKGYRAAMSWLDFVKSEERNSDHDFFLVRLFNDPVENQEIVKLERNEGRAELDAEENTYEF